MDMTFRGPDGTPENKTGKSQTSSKLENDASNGETLMPKQQNKEEREEGNIGARLGSLNDCVVITTLVIPFDSIILVSTIE